MSLGGWNTWDTYSVTSIVYADTGLRLRAGVLDMESGESRMNTFLPHMIPGPNLIGPHSHHADAPLTAECTRDSKENAPGPVGSRRLFGRATAIR